MGDEIRSRVTLSYEGPGSGFDTGSFADAVDTAELDFLEEVQDELPEDAEYLSVCTYVTLERDGATVMENASFMDHHRSVAELMGDMPDSGYVLTVKSQVYES